MDKWDYFDEESTMKIKATLGIGLIACVSTMAAATGAGDIAGFVDNPRLFNDFGGSDLIFNSNFDPSGSSLTIHEENYGTGNFANRHAAWFGDTGGNKVDFDYPDAWDMETTLQVNTASNVGGIEAGFQADLFGFGLFGVLTGNGEVAAFGSILPFYSFGTGIYSVGDEIGLRMIHRPGDGENSGGAPSTLEYMYNNMTTGSGWVSSGAIDFTTTEGGIPSSFDMFTGVGAQINFPGSDGVVDINFSNILVSVPAPTTLSLLSLAGLGAARRRR